MIKLRSYLLTLITLPMLANSPAIFAATASARTDSGYQTPPAALQA
ncbi:MAG: hypothetical protein RL748_3607, partial [Pseudomonadota bacterium]